MELLKLIEDYKEINKCVPGNSDYWRERFEKAYQADKNSSQLEPLVMQKTAGSADEIFIKGKIEGLEEARWQIVYALPHIDPNGRLEKKTKHLMDEMKKVQEELRAKL